MATLTMKEHIAAMRNSESPQSSVLQALRVHHARPSLGRIQRADDFAKRIDLKISMGAMNFVVCMSLNWDQTVSWLIMLRVLAGNNQVTSRTLSEYAQHPVRYNTSMFGQNSYQALAEYIAQQLGLPEVQALAIPKPEDQNFYAE